MEVLSIKLMYDILEDLIAKWATRYKLLVAWEQSWSPLATGRPLILVPGQYTATDTAAKSCCIVGMSPPDPLMMLAPL